ncbi:MAG: CBS and ACT domain-containing protein [Desulfobacteraceae bacterium]|nr:CBS and ACT domain-containing protein [Desulfobacteraceae bacterium]
MFVSRSMTRKLITITAEEGLFAARDAMRGNGIRHLPVVDAEGKLLGMITDRDIRSALPTEWIRQPLSESKMEQLEALRVKDIMSTELFTITPNYTIQDALLLIEEKKVGALPVVDEQGYLKGILSVRDLLRAFINVLGIGQPGTLLCILVEEKVGQLKRIVDAITEENISFGSILVAHYWEEEKRAVFPYLLTMNVSRIKKKLEGMGFELLDPMKWYLDQLPKNE